MDPEPAELSRLSSNVETSTRSSHQGDMQGIEAEGRIVFNGPSISLLGLAIAFATVGIPLMAVLSERPLGRESKIPTALESDGSNPSLPISFKRVGKPGS